jgi:phosphoribosylamine--glycine ligase
MAAEGYPATYKKNTVINGLDKAAEVENVQIFHAGTAEKNGQILAIGGRVLGVCAMGKDVIAARQFAYEAVEKVNWPEGFCRRDIAWRAIK